MTFSIGLSFLFYAIGCNRNDSAILFDELVYF